MSTVLITGAHGFIGRNLGVRLQEAGVHEVIELGRDDDVGPAAERADIVFHFAGVNRPVDESEFTTGNAGFTRELCAALARRTGDTPPIIFSSTSRADEDSAYGASKREAEQTLLNHGAATGSPVLIYRLTNVFGKWARPNYNSAVATFCHNIARGGDIVIHDASAPLRLIYIDDLVDAFVRLLDDWPTKSGYHEVTPVYSTTVGAVAETIRSFPASRETNLIPAVGSGLTRALYSTYLSYLPPDQFAYDVPTYGDSRGVFVEMLRTENSGQFSYFTAGPGITRGEHYHHSKAEKFLVLTGAAHFGFRHIVTGERHEIVTKGGEGRIVETIPGWTHNITNIGNDEMVVMLWASEIFDRARPDTIAMKV